MLDVARFLGYEPNRSGFIKSPFSQEKTASCKLYSEPGRGYYDFSTGEGGDCVKFVCRTQNLNSWEACRLMVEAFNLPVDMKRSHLTKKNVQELERKREADQKRKAIDQQKWVSEMDSLKSTVKTCENLLKSPMVEPLSDLWCAAVSQRNRAIIRLNDLVGIETTAADLRFPRKQVV